MRAHLWVVGGLVACGSRATLAPGPDGGAGDSTTFESGSQPPGGGDSAADGGSPGPLEAGLSSRDGGPAAVVADAMGALDGRHAAGADATACNAVSYAAGC